MAKRLFSCADTSTEELDYFSEIMGQHNIEYYTVPGTAFGLSKPSLWIKNDDDIDRAKELFKAHESIYAEMAREKYQKETGYNPNADKKAQRQFFLQHIYKKRALIPWIILGFICMYWYLSKFVGMFDVVKP